jgi:hypothetical protein
MARLALRAGLALAPIAVISAWLVTAMISDSGDWAIDAWPAVHALGEGRVLDYLEAEALMGPVSTLVQAPFAALGSGELDSYRWASFPCLVAIGLLGLYLAAMARRRGASPAAGALMPALCLLNPLTIEALQNGHPEELLTAAFAIGAVATACEGHRGRTALLLALAVASKQWAVLAVLPALMALPAARLRTALWSGAILATLMAPFLVFAPESFLAVHETASQTGRVVTPLSLWYPFADVTTEVYRVGSTDLVARVHEVPAWVGVVSHPLIVVLVLALPLGLVLRRGSFRLRAVDAMALLALLALVRCAFDPVDNLYYHLPLLIALLGWDAVAGERFPLRGALGTAVALFFWSWSRNLTDVEGFNLVYVGVAIVALAAICRFLSKPRPKFCSEDVLISRIKSRLRLSIKTG